MRDRLGLIGAGTGLVFKCGGDVKVSRTRAGKPQQGVVVLDMATDPVQLARAIGEPSGWSALLEKKTRTILCNLPLIAFVPCAGRSGWEDHAPGLKGH